MHLTFESHGTSPSQTVKTDASNLANRAPSQNTAPFGTPLNMRDVREAAPASTHDLHKPYNIYNMPILKGVFTSEEVALTYFHIFFKTDKKSRELNAFYYVQKLKSHYPLFKIFKEFFNSEFRPKIPSHLAANHLFREPDIYSLYACLSLQNILTEKLFSPEIDQTSKIEDVIAKAVSETMGSIMAIKTITKILLGKAINKNTPKNNQPQGQEAGLKLLELTQKTTEALQANLNCTHAIEEPKFLEIYSFIKNASLENLKKLKKVTATYPDLLAFIQNKMPACIDLLTHLTARNISPNPAPFDLMPKARPLIRMAFQRFLDRGDVKTQLNRFQALYSQSLSAFGNGLPFSCRLKIDETFENISAHRKFELLKNHLKQLRNQRNCFTNTQIIEALSDFPDLKKTLIPSIGKTILGIQNCDDSLI